MHTQSTVRVDVFNLTFLIFKFLLFMSFSLLITVCNRTMSVPDINCGVCFETFTVNGDRQHRLLPCGHKYCLSWTRCMTIIHRGTASRRSTPWNTQRPYIGLSLPSKPMYITDSVPDVSRDIWCSALCHGSGRHGRGAGVGGHTGGAGDPPMATGYYRNGQAPWYSFG